MSTQVHLVEDVAERDVLSGLLRETVQAVASELKRELRPEAIAILDQVVVRGAGRMTESRRTTPEQVYRAQLLLASITGDVLRESELLDSAVRVIAPTGEVDRERIVGYVLVERIAGLEWPWPFSWLN